MSVFGTRLLGKVDDVPGMFHVATKCFHINLIPLVPVQTYIVLSRSGNQFRGVKIPLSLKSFAMAWLRFLGWLGVIVGITIAFIGLMAHQPPHAEEIIPGIFLIVAAALLLALAYFFKPLKLASYQRALALAKLASVNEAGLEQLRKIYGEGFLVVPKNAAVTKSPQAL